MSRHPGPYDQAPSHNRFERGREASAQMKQAAYSSANRQHCLDMKAADAALKTAGPGTEPLRDRDRAYAVSADRLAGAYHRAEQEHNDRLAALLLHFSETPHTQGNPDTEHAKQFLSDQGLMPAAPPPDIQPNMVEIAFGGVSSMRHVDTQGRPMPAPNDPDPGRGTFGDAADQARWAVDPTAHAREFSEAKRAAVAIPSPTGTAPGATQGMKSRSRADTRAAEMLDSKQTLYIHAPAGWEDTKH